MKILKSKKGYTLIELLAVIMVMVTVGGIITSILVSALRGENKTNATTIVRQNGNYALTQMSKMIGFAKTFDGISTDNVTYNTNCIASNPPTPTPSPAPTQYKYIKVSTFDGGQVTFSCDSNTISSNGASLVDTSNLTVSNCYFMCYQADIRSAPSIDINFTLTRGSSGLFENQSAIPFETSVTFRNYDAN